MEKIYTLDFLKEKLIIKIGEFAFQAKSSVYIQYGETAVLVTLVYSDKPREGVNYFPLIVDFEEKFYAAGKIKKARFVKREGKPQDTAIITARMIDRSIRPLFNQRIRNDIQIIVTCLSIDGKNDPDILGILGASLCISLAGIDWFGPVFPVRVGYKDNKFIFNPTYEQREESLFDLVFVTTKNGLIPMIEFEGKEVKEELIISAIEEGKKRIPSLYDFIDKIIKENSSKELALVPSIIESKFKVFSEKFLEDKIEKAIYGKEKPERQKNLENLKQLFFEEALKKFGEDVFEEKKDDLEHCFYEYIKNIVHKNAIYKALRPDNRKLDEIRNLKAKIGFLPRTHGSGLFVRGLTQTLSVLTLAGPSNIQLLESMEYVGEKRFMHHYNFPPYSTGEVGMLRGPGRREIGHGYLAEKALQPLIPEKEKFPYTIRIVSEVLSSNGSTSMGSICSSSLALFDAGVPIMRHIGGISIGLMAEKDFSRYVLLTDIQGPEDHFGDMDFKVAGTKKGINAIQLDVKNQGLTLKIIKEALKKARFARERIISLLEKTIPAPRKEVSLYAPKVAIVKISPEKIRDLIGPNGRTIQNIIDLTSSEITIEEDGSVYITCTEKKSLEKAIQLIKEVTREYKVGDELIGEVVRLEEYGAFVKISNGIEGLLHISNILPGKRIKKITDVLKIGDKVNVEIINIDELGRLSFKLINKI